MENSISHNNLKQASCEPFLQEFNVRSANSIITFANRWDHFLKRVGINRGGNRVIPGLYALGKPAPDSPVFVTANYSRSFDALRKALRGTDCYILVLDTFGINVWCAAGKGTFGTDELVRRTEETKLSEIVTHRKLILPQLASPGVAAHEIKKRTGFNVDFGPVRAADLPEYLKTGKATAEMRRVRFTLRNRLELIPVELIQTIIIMSIAAGILFFIAGPMASAAAIAAILAGVVLFPILLPYIPTPNFSTKGFILGGIAALPFFFAKLTGSPEVALWQRSGLACAYLLTLSPVTAFLALNFTGATTFTSRTGVKREIFTYVPIMAWMFVGGVILSITFTLIDVLGG